jgi:hypothetical protein
VGRGAAYVKPSRQPPRLVTPARGSASLPTVDTRIPFLLGCVGLAGLTACKVYDPSLFTDGSGGGGGGGGASGSALCSAPKDCPGVDDECKKRSCVGGFCSLDFTDKDKPVLAQTPSDCQVVVCDGQGNMQAVPTSDPPDDKLECTVDTCNNSVPNYERKATGAPCTQDQGARCNDESACVECLEGKDCSVSNVCNTSTFKCAPAACGDTIKNGEESDIDCGGSQCSRCAVGKSCMNPSDCVGDTCVSGKCQPSCTDGAESAGETDIDCGGTTCAKCTIGKKCGGPSDCASNNCVTKLCFLDHLVINEIDYDQDGSDLAEFIEVYNGTGAPKALTDLALVFVNGANDLTDLSFALGPAGTLAAGQYLVLGTTVVKPPAGVPKLNFAKTQDNIQNGAPDGVALIDTKTAKLIDALSYEGAMPMADVTGLSGPVSLVEGTALPTSVADSNVGTLSLIRFPDGADTNSAAVDWKVSSTPTPGAKNLP